MQKLTVRSLNETTGERHTRTKACCCTTRALVPPPEHFLHVNITGQHRLSDINTVVMIHSHS